mmetsp:Transcript_22901/g.45946  ORF Transcript_22901/g.45946 Transcript_22901/m.45946 type:complete len:320 (+) Transcript_22901:2747-3706(+)
MLVIFRFFYFSIISSRHRLHRRTYPFRRPCQPLLPQPSPLPFPPRRLLHLLLLLHPQTQNRPRRKQPRRGRHQKSQPLRPTILFHQPLDRPPVLPPLSLHPPNPSGSAGVQIPISVVGCRRGESGGGGGGRDRIWEDYANSTIPSRIRLCHPRQILRGMHPTPPSGRHLHRLPRCRGNGRDARRNRRIHHSFRRRLQSPIHRVEISDGWYAFERGHERPPVVPIFGHRFGRGARTHSGHGRIDGPLDGTAAEEEKGIQARRIESGRHVRHVGRHQIPRLFQQRPLIESARTDLPGRSVLRGRTREELRRSRGEDGHSDP